MVGGCGTQKKVNLTGAVATVDKKTLESRPVTAVSQALQGVMPVSYTHLDVYKRQIFTRCDTADGKTPSAISTGYTVKRFLDKSAIAQIWCPPG